MNRIDHVIKNLTTKQIMTSLLLILIIVGSVIFVNNNEIFYNRTIAQINHTSITSTKDVTDEHGNDDQLFTQQITAQIKNGEHKGEHIHLTHTYSRSGAYDQTYQSGDEVFVSLNEESDDNQLTGSITNVKRDNYLLIVAWIFFFALLLVGKRQGALAGISLGINIILLSWALDIYVNTGMNLLWICGITVVVFTIISLLLVNGFNDKTYAAIAATLLGTFLSLLITFLALWITDENGLRYEEMEYLTRPYTLVFLAGLFIGSLGAVMDVAISISAALFELYEKNHAISIKALKESGLDIGKDIMGTMTNILFFAYISGSIPMLILYFKNASSLGYTLSVNLSLELTRALAGSIGIVITIPIGLFTTIFFIERKRAKQ